jgi:hypothetical protein
VNVTANLLLNVYGLNPVNITLDLCDILGGALCPLPMYNFTGSDSISLPDSLGVSGKIPGIAFKVPDLEGFAQLTLTEVVTGNVKACVQATLSNGWSTHQPAVEWVIGGFALATLLLAAWQSLSPETLLPFRLLDLIYLYQTIASTSLLSLNYPSSYRAFTLNFSWAIGLFSTQASSPIQRSINRMRHLTGGKLADAATGSAVGFVNRKLSPYNIPSSNFLASLPFISSLQQPNFSLSRFRGSTKVFRTLADASSQGEVQTVTAASSNVLQAGIPIYVNSIHIATANAFMTIFVCGFVLAACAAGVCLLGYGVLLITPILHRAETARGNYRSFTYAWCIRLVNPHPNICIPNNANISAGTYHILPLYDLCILSVDSEGFMAFAALFYPRILGCHQSYLISHVCYYPHCASLYPSCAVLGCQALPSSKHPLCTVPSTALLLFYPSSDGLFLQSDLHFIREW